MANFNFSHPEKFNFNQPENWEAWFKRFERFRQASGLYEKSEDIQVYTLVYSMGPEAEEIMSSFRLSEDNAKKWNTVTDKFIKYFVPKKNVIFERATFNQRVQQEHENVDIFVTALHQLAEHCEFAALKDQLIKDRIVVGIRNIKLAEKLQLDKDLTLEKAITEARQSETIKSQQHFVWGTVQRPIENIGAVDKGQKTKSLQAKSNKGSKPQRTKKCHRCGARDRHSKSNCPAKDSECYKCKLIGHWQKQCRTKVGEVQDVSGEPGGSNVFLGNINTQRSKPWMIDLKVGNRTISFKIDCGADVTCISQKQFLSLRDVKLQKTDRTLYSAAQEKLLVLGKIKCTLESDSKFWVTDIFVVVKDLDTALLGRPAIEALSVIQVID